MGQKSKYYVVWNGRRPGIYTSWEACKAQVHGATGARYKAFRTREEAAAAYAAAPPVLRKATPGPMEYRGVCLTTGQELFHYGPVYGTNNIGEFLAIVHGLALIRQQGLTDVTLYSDSHNALLWVRSKKCKTKLARTSRTEALYQLIGRAEQWLHDNPYDTPLVKWETERWGEIPADFGRK